MNEKATLYTILEVAENVDQETLAAAYALQLEASTANNEQTQLLRLCYQTLGNLQARATYDRKLRLQRATEQRQSRQITTHQKSLWQWLLPVLVLAVSFVLWKNWRSSAQPLQTPTILAAKAAPPLPAADTPETTPAVPEPTPAPPVQITALAMPATTNAPINAIAPPQRPLKKPGFDADYLAWSVFTIRQSRSAGSGVLIAPDKILTNCHVLAGAALNGLVVIHSMTKKITPVSKYARLDGEDACLLYAAGAGGEAIEWGSATSLRLSDKVHAFGHPGGASDITWSEGQLLARVEKNNEEFLISNNYCRPGSSGGPLLDDAGKLVGVVTAVQRFTSRVGEAPRYGACISTPESSARALLGKPLFPIALAPAQFIPNY